MIVIIILLAIAVFAYWLVTHSAFLTDHPPVENQEPPLGWNEIYDRHVRMEVMQREIAERRQQRLNEAWERYYQEQEEEW